MPGSIERSSTRQRYQRIREEDRNSRRSIADAIEVLRNVGVFNESSRAEIRVGSFRPLSGDWLYLVDVLCNVPSLETVFVVGLPTSTNFKAIRAGSLRRELFGLALLDDALVSDDAGVVLRDGSKLRAVEIIPTRLLNDPCKLDWRIVHHTISIIGAEEHCYRSVRADVPSPLRDRVPDVRFIDCSKLRGLSLPPLKELAYQIARRDWTLRRLSRQKIADSLRKFGIRLPDRRPRVQPV
jgi:hypothetical protein